jgi:hypothetical protein
VDGKAVPLGVDGILDFDDLHSRQHDHEVQFYAFNLLGMNGENPRAPAAPPGSWSRHSDAGPEGRAAKSFRMIVLTEQREIMPYKWVPSQ